MRVTLRHAALRIGGIAPGWAAIVGAFLLGAAGEPSRVALYPLAGAAVVLFGRQRFRRISWWLVLDGVVTSLTLAALVTAARSHVPGHTGHPLLDVLLIGLVTAAAVWQGLRPALETIVVSAGVVTFGLIDALWSPRFALPVGALVVAAAACVPRRDGEDAEAPEQWLAIVAPAGMSLLAVAMLAFGKFVHQLDDRAVFLGRLAFMVAFVRIFVSFVVTQRLLTRSLRDASSDLLTGLANRRALVADAAALLRDPEPQEHVIAIYDLDGFKRYNDTLGHEAGDRLLALLGARLRATVGERGSVYRLGGDEFCLLAPATGAAAEQLLRAAAAALSQSGAGIAIEASYGAASIPVEAADLSSALRLADRRMYEHKAARTDAASGSQQLELAEAR